MKIDESLLQKVAQNSRLTLTDAEMKKFISQMQEILDFFSQLNKVDVSQTEPSFQPVEVRNVMREDVPEPCLSREDALSLTAHKKDCYFKGPRSV